MVRHLRFLFVLVLLSIISSGYAQTAEMPIIAYWGVPDWRTTDKDFKTFSECGFTVSLYPYKSLDVLVRACRHAKKYGVSVLGSCPEMFDAPTKAASTLKTQEGFFGYNIQDEPNVHEIGQRQKDIEKLIAVDSTHIFYINLLPYQKKDRQWVSAVTKASDYPTYLRAASKTSCQQISFDHYPVTTKGIRDTWYHNLEMVRAESLKSGKPFWGFVLSVPHVDYPQPTKGALRLQVYANLVYGAQAIQYFTYWTPAKNKKYDFHMAPITNDGRKTKTYKLVQQMNRELRGVARLFYGADVLSVHHLGQIPEGTKQLETMPPNIRSLKIKGQKGVIVSQIERDGHRYLAVVNKDYKSAVKIEIQARNDTPRHITKQLREESMKRSYSVSAGDILLFRLL